MFFQRDYILRMIEMMGDLMRRIREMMDDMARMRFLEDTCQKHTGLSLAAAESLSAQSLEELLQPMPRLLVSEILFIRAESFSLPAGEKEALLHKSLHLLASLWEEGPLCGLRAERLLALKAQLLPRLNAQELMNCARFLGEAEQYADMEDALFQAAELLPPGPQREALCGEGAMLLEQAAKAPPKALAFARTGNGELLQSAQELRALGH